MPQPTAPFPAEPAAAFAGLGGAGMIHKPESEVALAICLCRVAYVRRQRAMSTGG